MMRVEYNQMIIKLSFYEQVTFRKDPSMIFRSIIGRQLRGISCVLKNSECKDCSLRYSCTYTRLFDPFLQKDNTILPGRNKVSQPFVFFIPFEKHKAVNDIFIHLTIFGWAREYLPYLIISLQRAGKAGIFKDRIRFSVDSIKDSTGKELLQNERFEESRLSKYWEMKYSVTGSRSSYRLNFLSPVRIKSQGRYLREVSYEQFMRAFYRRIIIITSLYGNNSGQDIFDQLILSDKKTSSHLGWVDYDYYSSRQHERLKLGGLIGYMELEGEFSSAEKALLKAATLFHVGKNTGFGLGHIEIEEVIL